MSIRTTTYLPGRRRRHAESLANSKRVCARLKRCSKLVLARTDGFDWNGAPPIGEICFSMVTCFSAGLWFPAPSWSSASDRCLGCLCCLSGSQISREFGVSVSWCNSVPVLPSRSSGVQIIVAVSSCQQMSGQPVFCWCGHPSIRVSWPMFGGVSVLCPARLPCRGLRVRCRDSLIASVPLCSRPRLGLPVSQRRIFWSSTLAACSVSHCIFVWCRGIAVAVRCPGLVMFHLRDEQPFRTSANSVFEHWRAGLRVWNYAALFGSKVGMQTSVA